MNGIVAAQLRARLDEEQPEATGAPKESEPSGAPTAEGADGQSSGPKKVLKPQTPIVPPTSVPAAPAEAKQTGRTQSESSTEKSAGTTQTSEPSPAADPAPPDQPPAKEPVDDRAEF